MYSKTVTKNKGPINKSQSYLRYKKIEDSDTDSDIIITNDKMSEHSDNNSTGSNSEKSDSHRRRNVRENALQNDSPTINDFSDNEVVIVTNNSI